MLRAILTCQLVLCPFRSIHGFHKIHFERRALTTRQLRSKNVSRKIVSESKVLKCFAAHFSTDSFGTFVRT